MSAQGVWRTEIRECARPRDEGAQVRLSCAALPPVSAAAKPGRISFVDDHKIDGSRVECSTINSARSSSVEW